jgi:ribonuclease P protein component
VKYSAAGARRAASGSPFSCRPSTQAPERASHPRRLRLTRGSDLQRVLREGKRVRTEHLEVRVLASLLHHPRVGIIVPKHRRSIVERNRLKRRLREITRCDIIPGIAGRRIDLVVRAGPGAYGVTFETLRAELTSGVRRAAERGWIQ